MATAAVAPNQGEQVAQDHPEDLDQSQSFGENNTELPEQLQRILRGLFKKFMKEEMYERRLEVMTGRRLRFYERGFQHITWSSQNWMFQQVTPGMTTTVGGEQLEAPNYIDDYNIFQPYLLTRVAVLTQNPPGIDFQPEKAGDSVCQQAADDAELYRAVFDHANDRAALQMQAARYMGLSSRVVAWTRTEADAQRWGTTPEGDPVQRETTDIYGELETKCRITARELSETDYFVISFEKGVLRAKKENPDFREKIKAGDGEGIGEETYERIARLGVLQGQKAAVAIGDLLKNLVTEHHCWLRPAAFEDDSCNAVPDGTWDYQVADEETGEQRPAENCREVLNELFPDGAHAKFIGDVYTGSWNEAIEDHISCVWAYEGDGMSRMAYMYPALVLQDRFNDFMNAAAEVFDYGWPARWVAGDEADGDAIRDQKSEPFNVYTKKLTGNVTALENLFYQEPNPELPETFIEHIQYLAGTLAQFILGAPPALFGGSMKNSDTAHAYAQARDQAMGVIGPVWMQMQRLFASIYRNAALAAGQNPQYTETIVAPVQGGPGQELMPKRLQKGRFGAFPDKDSGFPETESAKRQMLQAFLALIGQNPLALQAFMSVPGNWELFKNLMGVPQLDFVQAKQYEKEQRDTEQLLKNKPLPPDPDMLAMAQQQHAAAALIARGSGQPEPPPPNPDDFLEPSVGVDPIFDNHQFAWEYWQGWMTDNADRLRAEGNADGVKNCELHALQHKKFIEAAQAGMAGPIAPPIPPKKPPVPAGQGTPAAPGATQAEVQG